MTKLSIHSKFPHSLWEDKILFNLYFIGYFKIILLDEVSCFICGVLKRSTAGKLNNFFMISLCLSV